MMAIDFIRQRVVFVILLLTISIGISKADPIEYAGVYEIPTTDETTQGLITPYDADVRSYLCFREDGTAGYMVSMENRWYIDSLASLTVKSPTTGILKFQSCDDSTRKAFTIVAKDDVTLEGVGFKFKSGIKRLDIKVTQFDTIKAKVETAASTPLTEGIKLGKGHYVDLGLPSGTLWATTNIGADSAEDSGSYYAWGETKEYIKGLEKDTFDTLEELREYQMSKCFAAQLSNAQLEIFDVIDSKYRLTSEYDVATANWGKGWKMPNYEEAKELVDNCVVIETTYNGINGYLFIGKNNNRIFIPDAGYYVGTLFPGQRVLLRYDLNGNPVFTWRPGGFTISKQENRIVYWLSEGAYYDGKGNEFNGYRDSKKTQLDVLCFRAGYRENAEGIGEPVRYDQLPIRAVSTMKRDNGIDAPISTSLAVYPNPATDRVYIPSAEEDDEIVVSNMLGQIVVRAKGNNVYLGSLPAGNYIVSCQGLTNKIIKK